MMKNNDLSRRTFLRTSALTTTGLGLGLGLVSGAEAGQPAAAEKLTFPKGFQWGVASAAYQIEGAYNADGKGESIWDRFTHIPGNTKATGDVVADHYHRYREDVKLLKQLGVNVYRFSIAWTRIFPDGRGAVNPKGVAFYKDLIRLLVENGIKPAVTLNHWDLPQKLQDIGGWANREVVDHFEQYARFCFKEFGKDVAVWITHNEPWVVAFVGYHYGTFAPGIRDFSTAILTTHHLLLSHGKAVKAYKEMGLKGEIGITLDLQLAVPATDSAQDKAAAERENRAHHAWFADPIFKGKYPEEIWSLYEQKGVVMPVVSKEDLAIISTPVDFLGLNYYYLSPVKDAPGKAFPLELEGVSTDQKKYKQNEGNPDGLYMLLMRLQRDYNKKIIITENGRQLEDYVNLKGEVNDEERIEYILQHLKACHQAIQDGVNLAGYYVWSFLDDYEWNDFGRMGLVYVDYKTQQRIIKKSGHWYREVVKNNGITV